MVNNAGFSIAFNQNSFGRALLFRLTLGTAFERRHMVTYGLILSDGPVSVPDSGGYLRAAQDLSDFQLHSLIDIL